MATPCSVKANMLRACLIPEHITICDMFRISSRVNDGLSPSLFWSKDTSQDQRTVTTASGEDPNAFAMRVLRDSDTGITSGRERPDRAFHGPIPAA
jgi:hypothetical protein